MPRAFTIQISDNQLLGTHYLNPNAIAQIIIIHGFGEHQGRYIHVAQEFLDDGFGVFTIDLSGHGKSDGKRGDILSMDQYIEELRRCIQHVKDFDSNLPLYLMGHSMGGLVCATYALKIKQNQLAGLILSSPWFKLAIKPNPIRVALAKVFVIIGVNMAQKSNIDVTHLSSDLSVGKAYDEDELVHGKLTPRAFFEIFDHGKWCLQQARHLTTPCLVTHGSEDKIISIEGSQIFATQAHASFHVFEGARHEPHNEYEKGKFIREFGKWIKNQMN